MKPEPKLVVERDEPLSFILELIEHCKVSDDYTTKMLALTAEKEIPNIRRRLTKYKYARQALKRFGTQKEQAREQLAAVERYNKGALAALWGEKPVRESEKVRKV